MNEITHTIHLNIMCLHTLVETETRHTIVRETWVPFRNDVTKILPEFLLHVTQALLSIVLETSTLGKNIQAAPMVRLVSFLRRSANRMRSGRRWNNRIAKRPSNTLHNLNLRGTIVIVTRNARHHWHTRRLPCTSAAVGTRRQHLFIVSVFNLAPMDLRVRILVHIIDDASTKNRVRGANAKTVPVRITILTPLSSRHELKWLFIRVRHNRRHKQTHLQLGAKGDLVRNEIGSIAHESVAKLTLISPTTEQRILVLRCGAVQAMHIIGSVVGAV